MQRFAEGSRDDSETDYFVESLLTQVVSLYKGNRTKLLLTQLKRTFTDIKQFDAEPQNPQDTSDILSDVMEVFLKEVLEISDNIRQINEDAILIHAVKEAEKEIKEEFMKLMQAKQQEIMLRFGLKEAQNRIQVPLYGDLDMTNQMTIQTPEGNQNIGDRILELNAKQIIQVQNSKFLKEAVVNYVRTMKLSSKQALLAVNILPRLDPDEEMWPMPKDLQKIP